MRRNKTFYVYLHKSVSEAAKSLNKTFYVYLHKSPMIYITTLLKNGNLFQRLLNL